jgi:hypothetical protein
MKRQKTSMTLLKQFPVLSIVGIPPAVLSMAGIGVLSAIFYNLGDLYLGRFDHTGDLQDIDHAISNRECHGFINPHGLQVRVATGAGAGWLIATPEKPAPVARV